MAPVTGLLAPCRRALAALVLLLGALLVAPSPASAAAPDDTADDATEVFLGRVTGVEQIPVGTRPVRTRLLLTVSVLTIYGTTTVDTEEVVVHTKADSCETYPTTPETKRLLFRLTSQTNGLIADSCADVLDFSEVDQTVLDGLTDPRSPVSSGGTSPDPEPFADPTYTCPDTHEAIPTFDTDSSAERAGCDALDEPSSADRAAAPGLALTIVGLLGLVVVGQLRSRRRR